MDLMERLIHCVANLLEGNQGFW